MYDITLADIKSFISVMHLAVVLLLVTNILKWRLCGHAIAAKAEEMHISQCILEVLLH